ncbi:MAG TPA: hypothetical protein VK444_06275 [Methanobacteriaceae archaeon]|nr:hypothetical protein [Methanobacteriaceae archaeon]
MRNWTLILTILTMVVFLSGCINSDISRMDQLTSTINDHLKKGDSYYNQAVNSINKNLYEPGITQTNNALSEFDQARSSAQEGLIYAKNTKEDVFINYFQLTIQELDLRINATNEMKVAIPYLQGNETTTANQHIDLANNYMQQSIALQTQKTDLVKQNVAKFK